MQSTYASPQAIKRPARKIPNEVPEMNGNVSALHDIVETLDGYVWGMDRQFRYTWLNRRLADRIRELFKINIKPGDKVLDKFPLVDPIKLFEWRRIYEQGLQGKSQQLIQEFSLDRKSFFFELSVNPIKNGKEVIGISCFARELREDSYNKQKLWKVEKLFYTISKHTADLKVLLDETGKVLFCNHSFAMKTGYVKGDTIIKKCFIQKDEGKEYAIKHALSQPGKPLPFSGWLECKNKAAFSIEGIVVNVLTLPEINAIVCYFRDITNGLQAKSNRQKEVTRAVIEAQEKEREVLGRELHDN